MQIGYSFLDASGFISHSPHLFAFYSYTVVIFLGKDNSELEMVPQTTYFHLHGWQTIS